MGFSCEVVSCAVLGERNFQEVMDKVFVDLETGTVCLLGQGEEALLIRPE